MSAWSRLFLSVLLLAFAACDTRHPARGEATEPDQVVLLHGLAGSPATMWLLGRRLRDEGYRVTAVRYPSRDMPIDEQVEHLQQELERCCLDGHGRIHFVTHSMGGIVARALLARYRPANLGRVVMLSPPNQGTELADALGGNFLIDLFLGPAVQELGTSPDSVPNRLGPPDYEVGILAADRAWNLIGSMIIPGPDDGTVPIERMKLDGMVDFRTIPATHTFIMNDPEVAIETTYFLRHGRFRPETAPTPAQAPDSSLAPLPARAADHRRDRSAPAQAEP